MLQCWDMTNDCSNTVIFTPERHIGVVDHKSIGYYMIKQSVLQQNFNKYNRF